ncbi:hypothetical protein B0H11DRAFT_1807991 [Mycena galericulata]|nr:hypothetical protein B0H11DRAFT_1807991 [Mycena galericulata]
MTRALPFFFVALGLHYAAAQISLIVPFADEQPISADVVGVDTAQGRTTWALHQGALTGTFTDAQGDFPGTATLVEGSDYVSFTYVEQEDNVTATAGGLCSIQAGTAFCVANANGATITDAEAVTPFAVQVATGTPAPTGTKGTSQANAGSGTGSGSAPANTHPSSSVRASASGFCALVGLLLGYYFA